MQDTGYEMQDTGYEMQDAGYEMQDAGYEIGRKEAGFEKRELENG